MNLTREGNDPAGPGRRCRAAALLAVTAGAVVLAGCSSPSAGPSGPTPAQARQQLARALRSWAAFPASASPRPIVLTSPRISDPASGFPDAAVKLAYIAGAISPPVTLPSGPATAAGYPLIGARAAVDVLRTGAAHGAASSLRLAVTAMSLGTGVFDTDRGPLRLPAWVLDLRQVPDPARVLAVAPARFFQAASRSAGSSPLLRTASLGPDGRTLTVQFVGAQPGSGDCTAGYRLLAAGSAVAVAVTLVTDVHGDPNAACSSVGYSRHASTVLPARLGDRVLVDAPSAMAVIVTRASRRPR
jgi:hypothetical protein